MYGVMMTKWCLAALLTFLLNKYHKQYTHFKHYNKNSYLAFSLFSGCRCERISDNEELFDVHNSLSFHVVSSSSTWYVLALGYFCPCVVNSPLKEIKFAVLSLSLSMNFLRDLEF